MREVLWAVLAACAFADAGSQTVMRRVSTRILPEGFNMPRAAGFDEPSHGSLYIASFGAANQGPPQVARLRPLDLFTLNDTVLPSAIGALQTPLHYAEGLVAQSDGENMFVLHQTTPAVIARVDRQSFVTRGTVSLPEQSTALSMEEDDDYLFVVAHTAPGSIFKYDKKDLDAEVVPYDKGTLNQDAQWPMASTSDKNYLYIVTRPYANPNPKPAKLLQIRKSSMEAVLGGEQSLCIDDMEKRWTQMTLGQQEAQVSKEQWLLDDCEPLLVSTMVSDDAHLYLITSELPGRIVKYSKQTTTTALMRLQHTRLNTDENFVRTAQVEKHGDYLFVITNPVDTTPAIVKLRKDDLSRVGVHKLLGHERGAHASAIDSAYIYVVLASSPGAVIKLSKGPNLDCTPGPWAPWSACTKTCEGGSQSRSRDIAIRKEGNGKDCPAVNQTQQCNTHECPVACEVGGWGPMSPCDVHTGHQTRYRKIIQRPMHGGLPCPVLNKTTTCTVDCVVSGWGQWGECNQRRGERYQIRNRTVTAKNGGRHCPRLHRSEHCNVDCAVSQWSQWGRCGEHSGVRQRQRRVLVMNKHFGKLCPVLSDFEDCVMHCLAGPWTTFGECRNGTSVRTRKIIKSARNGGLPCTTEQMSRCAVACEVSTWSPWTDCDKASGTRFRNRTVTKRPQNAPDNACPDLDEVQNCDVDCEISLWSQWSSCNDHAMQERARIVEVHPAFQGEQCPDLFQERNCTTDCEVSPWGPYDSCSATCNGGTHTRYREVTVTPTIATGGEPCPALEESKQCNTQPCHVQSCAMSDWSAWGECSKPCGSGLQARTRSVVTEPGAGAEACPPNEDKRGCNTHLCTVNCLMGEWNPWTECDPKEGTQTRDRPVVDEPQAGGASCPHKHETQTCKVNCTVSDWGGWSACELGLQVRQRFVTQAMMNGGERCPTLQDIQDCGSEGCSDVVTKWPASFTDCSPEGFQSRERTLKDAQGWVVADGIATNSGTNLVCALRQRIACVVNCEMAEWGSWSTICDKASGTKTRQRDTLIYPKHGGAQCPLATDEADCNVDCEVSQWGTQGTCNKITGQQMRVRSIVHHAKHDGNACPELSSTEECKVHCELAEWGGWSACDMSTKVETRTRAITTPPLNGGDICDTLEERRDCAELCDDEAQAKLSPWDEWSECNVTTGRMQRARTSTDLFTQCRLKDIAPCNVNCVVSDWGSYSACDIANDRMLRNRTITVQPLNGGYLCPSLHESSTCNCVLGSMGGWSTCNPETGTKARVRAIAKPAQNDGFCESFEERSEHMSCEVDCMQSDWGGWGDCNNATGISLRRRETYRVGRNGGILCGDSEEYDDCEVHCHATEWGPYSECGETTGLQERHRSVIHDLKNGGKPCTLHEEITCDIDCKMSNWTDWQPCDFNTITQIRQRTIQVVPLNHGKPCPANSEQRVCQVPTPAPTPTQQHSVPTPAPAFASVRVAEYDYSVTVQLTLVQQGQKRLRDYDVISTMEDVKSVVQKAMVVYAHLPFDDSAEVRCISGCEEEPPADSMHFSVELMAPDVQRAMLIRQALKATNAAFRFKETLEQVYAERTQQNFDGQLNVELDEAQVVGTINPKDRVELVHNTTEKGEMYTKVLSAELYLANVNFATFDVTARKIFKYVLQSSHFLNVKPRQVVIWQTVSGESVSGSIYARINVTTTPSQEELVAYRYQLLVADPQDFQQELAKKYAEAKSAEALQNIAVEASPNNPGIDLTDLMDLKDGAGRGTGGETEVETFNDEVKSEKAQSPAEKMRAQLVYVAGGFLFIALVIFVIALVVRYRKRRLEKNAFFGELEAEYDQENLLDDGDWAALGDFGNENFAETNPMYKMNNAVD